jgi:hypothetical protein
MRPATASTIIDVDDMIQGSDGVHKHASSSSSSQEKRQQYDRRGTGKVVNANQGVHNESICSEVRHNKKIRIVNREGSDEIHSNHGKSIAGGKHVPAEVRSPAGKRMPKNNMETEPITTGRALDLRHGESHLDSVFNNAAASRENCESSGDTDTGSQQVFAPGAFTPVLRRGALPIPSFVDIPSETYVDSGRGTRGSGSFSGRGRSHRPDTAPKGTQNAHVFAQTAAAGTVVTPGVEPAVSSVAGRAPRPGLHRLEARERVAAKKSAVEGKAVNVEL